MKEAKIVHTDMVSEWAQKGHPKSACSGHTYPLPDCPAPHVHRGEAKIVDVQRQAADQDAADVDLTQAERAAAHYLAIALRRMADDPLTLTAAHLALENILVDMRDSGISIMNMNGGPANGLVIRYRDGTPSDIIRLGTRDAVRLTLEAVADDLDSRASS